MSAPDEDNQANILEVALKKFVDAYLQGRQPDIDEFVKQYPKCEDLIRQRIQDLQKINTLFDSLVQADERDFEDAVTGGELVGRKIASFEIAEMIGRGGMGVVYLARDTKLDRSVAIKSMPADLAGDPNARMRFLREAKLLASLNHPNIAAIYDIIEQGESAGYLILEYVPGETLAQRIAREPLKLAETLSIGRQVAEAVSAAHDKGVIHRDLKPGNIKITLEGKVKVLDFGLAKAAESEGRGGETTVTGPGRVIGTPAYMSPEQARGKPADHRTDIWSFGCIMYEMLTGHLPFEGETATDTLARIIERQPDWQALPESTPADIRALLRRCLEKEPHRRLGDIADARIEISETLSRPVTGLVVTIGAKLRTMAMIIGAAIIIVLSIVAVKFIPKKEISPSPKEIRLVVLPFENLGPVEQEWFADGMADEITTRLAGIHGLGVISRQSAIQYKNKEIGTQQIAKELNVDYILEGTVQCERPSDPNSQVRIRTQLIKAADDTHVWAQPYDNDMRDIFRLQSDVAEKVAQALDITLLEPERQAIESRPTENNEAYVYYVRGKEYRKLGSQEDNARAIQMYERATELDPNYAQAYASLSNALTSMYWVYGGNREHLARAKKEVDRALELDPDLPGAHVVLGRYYYQGHLDYDRALEQFAIARRSHPNHVWMLAWTGYAQRRQGKFEQALANLKRAYELNPASTSVLAALAHTPIFLRRYEETERYLDRLISLGPDKPGPYVRKAWLYLLWQGDTVKARAVLDDALVNTSETANGFFRIHDLEVTIDIYNRDYEEALKKLSSKSEDFDDMVWFIPDDLRRAEVYGYLGDEQLEQQYYKSAVAILEEEVRHDPNDHRCHSTLGKAYAGLGGREKDAIREGKLGVECLPIDKDAVNGPLRVEELARIYVMTGEFDAAIDKLEFLLSIPSEMSIPLLRLNPAWDPLRDHSRFKKLIEAGK